MNPNPQSPIDEPDAFQLSVRILLKSTLEYDAGTSTLASKIADDVKSICQAEDAKVQSRKDGSKQGVEDALSLVWFQIIDIARSKPGDHPQQDCLAKAVDILRLTHGTAPGMGGSEWSELPGLSLAMRDEWNYGHWEPDEEFVPEEDLSAEDLQEFEDWKNQNSFAARLTTASYAPSIYLAIWELREGLEIPPVKGCFQVVRIWVACEWLLRCPEVILNALRERGVDDANAMDTGSLCGPEIPNRSIHRWLFWRKRLQELSADAENLKLKNSIVERMSQTVEKMDAVFQPRFGKWVL